MIETKLRILIVDDDTKLCANMCDVLEKNDYTVEYVNNGKDAIAISRKNKYDLILMNIALPDISGSEVVREISTISSSTEFIYITGNVSVDSAIKAVKQENVISYETKPLDMDYFLAFIKQVIERKRVDEKLRESEERYCKLVETAQDAIMCDINGIISDWNKSAERVFGYTKDEIIGKPVNVLLPDRYKKEHQEEFERFSKTGEAGIIGKTAEVSGLTKEGVEIPIEMSLAYQKIENEQHLFTAIIRDITERKKAERRLNAQHEVTKVLVESATIKEASSKIIQAVCMALEWDLGEIWEFDQQKKALYNTEIWHVPSLKIPEFKAATEQITFPAKIGLPGRVWESAEPLWIADVVHDTNFHRASVADKEGVHGAFGFPIIIGNEVLGTLCFFSCEIRKPDKDLLDMMKAIGRQIGLFIKRKQAEEALLRSEKLHALGTITAGVAHEFNNILAIISGNAQLLETSRKDDKELMEVLRTIKRAVNDGAQISGRMLKFTKTAKDTAGFAPFDINELINQALEFTMPRWKNAAQAKGINYCMDTEGMGKISFSSILCRPTELREVFVNLINNALDAMPDGGIITVKTRRVLRSELGVGSEEGKDSLSARQAGELKGDFVEITFADTGEGMSEEVKKSIFDPFFTTKGAAGTGLGMSTSYGIVAGHGGNIEVESEVGKGSTFTLQFPAAAKANSPEESSEPEQGTKSKCLRILVVDNEKDICNILDKFFSKKGHLVSTVDNGREAIILAKAADYDLVLCDLAMPEVFGYDVIKALNKLEKRPKIGIITGWGEKLKPMEDEGLKVDFIIKKPFDFSELTKHINDLGIKELGN